ncbi:MAG TPA: thioesterase family protein [Nocardia sp.]|uniref:thioesterase family protein n=1 Tax=Nocardia sp. TaxID=1821 RepID=UPI002B4AE2A6|nr:thioesterase family protein [Nocardia sp.]HLS76524.1 thioesterase family protein [Nocardia sp.]
MTTDLSDGTATASGGRAAAHRAPFSDVCAVRRIDHDSGTDDAATYRGVIADTWTVGPKVHGGTMVAGSAAAATAWLRESDPERAAMSPIAVSSDFLGAPEPGEVEYEVRTRKVGRQICLVDVTLTQGGKPRVRSALTFGHLDDAAPIFPSAAVAGDAAGQVHHDMPAEPSRDAVGYEDSPLGKVVNVSAGADLAMDGSWAPFLTGGTGLPRLRLWIRPFEGDRSDPEVAAYFAMMAADISPPVPMNLGHFGWAPTVQMTTYLRRRPAPGWLRVVATTHEIGERMFDCDQLVLDSTGAVVAQSRQLALLPQQR